MVWLANREIFCGSLSVTGFYIRGYYTSAVPSTSVNAQHKEIELNNAMLTELLSCVGLFIHVIAGV